MVMSCFAAELLRMTVSRLDQVDLLPPIRKVSSQLVQVDLPLESVGSFL
jgi:hypothetical protein